DVAEPGSDADTDPPAVERRQGVLQPDAELADDLLRVGQLLAVLVLREVLVAEPASEVANVPATPGVLRDFGIRAAGQRRLVERVRDHLADRMRDRPVLQDALDVEVELPA